MKLIEAPGREAGSPQVPSPVVRHVARAAVRYVLPILLLAVLLRSRSGGGVVLTVSAVAAVLVVMYLLARTSATVLFTGAFITQVFSGNWGNIGLPIGLDRLLLALCVLALAREWLTGRLAGVPIRFTTTHALLLAVSGWALVSALAAGTLLTTAGAFALLDRLGVVPFLAFVLAPRLYGEAKQRNVLLCGLVLLGFYLGGTALAEGLGIDALVLPGYILDPSIGIHAERARGPFVEAVAMGFALVVCAVAALMARSQWRNGWARACALTVAAMCGAGTLFTLTRAVWLGTILAFLAAALVTPALRRTVLPVLAGGAGTVALLLAVVPGLASRVGDRAASQRPLWDRYNSNAAAANIVEAHPLAGVGWQRFPEVSTEWTQQAADYPITTIGIEVHNVFLSHAAELGLPGALLYLLAWSAAVGRGVFTRGGPTHQLWRTGLVAVAVVWLVVASFGPLSYAFANTALWLFAGIAATTARAPERPDALTGARPR